MCEAERWRTRREIERGAALQCIATISSQFSLSPHSFSFTLMHPVGPWPASVFYLCPITQNPGGVHDFVSRKTGYVYREMRKTLLRELNHRNSYLPRPLLTSVQNCVNAQTHT